VGCCRGVFAWGDGGVLACQQLGSNTWGSVDVWLGGVLKFDCIMRLVLSTGLAGKATMVVMPVLAFLHRKACSLNNFYLFLVVEYTNYSCHKITLSLWLGLCNTCCLWIVSLLLSSTCLSGNWIWTLQPSMLVLKYLGDHETVNIHLIIEITEPTQLFTKDNLCIACAIIKSYWTTGILGVIYPYNLPPSHLPLEVKFLCKLSAMTNDQSPPCIFIHRKSFWYKFK